MSTFIFSDLKNTFLLEQIHQKLYSVKAFIFDQVQIKLYNNPKDIISFLILQQKN